MERPNVNGLSVHDAVVEDNKSDFGECEGWDVNHGGSEDNLVVKSAGFSNVISISHTFWKTSNTSGVTFHRWIPIPPKR